MDSRPEHRQGRSNVEGKRQQRDAEGGVKPALQRGGTAESDLDAPRNRRANQRQYRGQAEKNEGSKAYDHERKHQSNGGGNGGEARGGDDPSVQSVSACRSDGLVGEVHRGVALGQTGR